VIDALQLQDDAVQQSEAKGKAISAYKQRTTKHTTIKVTTKYYQELS